jgi:hypothetical protein
MTDTPKPDAALRDGELDRATDMEYASVSTLAVLALVAGLAGVVAFWAPPLVGVPVLAAVLGGAALRQIGRSAGVLAGRKPAMAGLMLGVGLALAAGVYHGLAWWNETSTLGTLKARALAVTDDLAAGRYDEVFNQFPEDFRRGVQQSPEEFRRRVGPLFEGAGPVVSRRLDSLLPLEAEGGVAVSPAEMTVEFEKRTLALSVWFQRRPSGEWDLVGIGGQETIESMTRHEGAPAPRPVPPPYTPKRGHEGHQH